MTATVERSWPPQRVIVMALSAVAILVRSAIFIFWEQSYFDSDQAVIGLMGKDLHPLSHLVQAMRKTRQTSEFIEKMGPFFVGYVLGSSVP